MFAVFAIRTSWFQTWLAQQASSYYSKKLGTEVSIDKVDIKFFDRVDIKGVYVEDIRKDTFIYTDVIHADIEDWSIRESYVQVSNATLENGSVYIRKYEGDSTLNFQHIVDYFTPEEEDTTTSDFKIGVSAFSLQNVHFIYDDFNHEPTKHGMDFSHIDLTKLSGTFSDFDLKGKEIGVRLDHLQLVDRSGLTLTDLNANVTYGPELLSLKKLKIGLGRTLLKADYFELSTPNGGEDWQHFVHRVKFNAHFKDSRLNLADLAYFVPDLWGLDQQVNIHNLEANNQVFGMKLKNVDISMLDTTRIQGNLEIPDFSDIASVRIEQDLDLFRTSISDLRQINWRAILSQDDYLLVNKNLTQFHDAGVISLKEGSFFGYTTDFVVNGQLYSGIGNVTSEYGLKFKYHEEDGLYHYTGAADESLGKHIIVQDLDIGVIADNDVVGKVNGYLRIDGKGFSEDDLDVEFNGPLSSIHILDYTYNDVQVIKGHFAKNKFTGKIDIEDDNLALNYEGSVDMNKPMHFDFMVLVDSAQVAELSGQEQKLYQRLASSVKVNIYGTGLNEIHGEVNVENFAYAEEGKEISMESMDLVISRSEKSDTIQLRSPFVDVDLTGKYDLEDVGHALTEQFSYVLSNLVEDPHLHDADHEHYSLNIDVKDANTLFEFLDEDIRLAPGTTIRSEFNHDEHNFALDINSDYFEFGKTRFEVINVENHLDSVRAKVSYNCEFAQLTDSIAVRNLYFDSKVKDNVFISSAGWDGTGDLKPALFAFESEVSERMDVLTNFRPSFFYLQDHKYSVDDRSSVLWNPEEIIFKDFKISNKDHYVGLDGTISHDPFDWLNITVHDFELSDLNGILSETIELDGVLNIDGKLADAYKNVRFDAESSVKDLHLDKQLVGDIEVRNRWNERAKSISAEGLLIREGKETFTFEGNYFVQRARDNLDFEANFNRTDIAFLNAFDDPELYTDIAGILDGRVFIKGELDNPVVTGKLEVVESEVMVPMFNVKFGAAGIIKLNDGEIIADHLKLLDQEGNTADAQMQVYHYGWKDWNYNVLIDMDNPLVSDKFLAMDTHYKEGDYYYGKAYISGMVDIFGWDEHTEIEVNAQTEEGTDLVLPMYGSSELEEGSFIIFDETFFLPDSLKNQNLTEDVKEVKRLGMTLTMKFNVTKDAQVKIVFDPVLEDQIVSRGEGDLEIKMNDFGDLTMFGEYIIRDGKYEMRVKQVVEEDFVLRDGSAVQWTGSPYDALINIAADFERQVSLSDIMPPEAERRKKEQVLGTLLMTNTLMNPTLGFDIVAPNTDDFGKKAINEVKADNDELNKQFFSLLVLKRFLPKHGAAGGGDAVLGLMETQINSILSGMSDNYNLQAGLSETSTTIGLTTQLNERTTITTSFGVIADDEAGVSASNFVGDVDIEYRLNKDGSFTMNFFNETNSSSITSQGDYTQGISLHYQETFNTTKEFRMWQKFLNMFRKKDKRIKFDKRSRRSEKWVPLPEASDSTNVNTNP